MTAERIHIHLFAPIPFSFLHQRPQSLANAFLAQDVAVTYIEPCGFTEYLAGRKSGILLLLTTSLWYWFLGAASFIVPLLRRKPASANAAGQPILRIVSLPLVIPQNRCNSPFLEKLNASIFRQALRRRVFRHMDPAGVSVAIVENPFFGAVLAPGDFTHVYYDCLDEIALFSGHADIGRYKGYESALLNMCSGIFVTAGKLEERMRTVRDDLPIVRVPNGVDFDWFQSRVSGQGPPDDIAGLRKPVVGYVGVLRSWLDYELIAEMAKAMPDVSVVIVGPWDFEDRIAHLRNIPNLHWLGRREFPSVPLYIKAFDVCIIPFLPGEISETTNPVKIFEYFAFGKPVVSSPLRELQPYAAQGLVSIAGNLQEFVTLVRKAFAEEGDIMPGHRRAVARENSWSAHVHTMLQTIRQN